MRPIEEHKTTPIHVESIKVASYPSMPLHQRDQATLALLSQSSKALQEAAKQASHNSTQSSANPILEALLAQIQCDAKIDTLTKESANAVFNSISAQINELQDLQKQISDLQHKLAGNLSPAEIEKIEAQIKEIQQEYNQAINEQQQAEKDKSREEEANNELRKENQELQKEAAAAKDPKIKKQLEDQIKANNQKISENSSKIHQDDTIIDQTNSTIHHVEELLQSLQATYPGFKDIITQILTGMLKHQNVDSLVGKLVSQLSQISTEDAHLATEIQSLQSQLSELQNDIAEKVSKTDQLAGDLEKIEQKGNSYGALLKELKEFIQQLAEAKSLNKVDLHFKDEDIKLRTHLADRQYELKRGLV